MTRFATAQELRLWHRVMREPESPPVTRQAIMRSNVLDLHGFRVQDAYGRSNAFLAHAARHRLAKVTIITGKSGQIRQEISHWLAASAVVKTYEFINDGAVAVRLKVKIKD